ncbi:MAG: hypothetical protein OIF50_07410 [Flavobacteriaceae bacterium]|nr:hypothetical protein [Flavobacteriaceae bacterium]
MLFLISLNALGQKKPLRIPFELKANRIFIQGKINNKKAILMYDSGASGLDIQNRLIKNKSNKITIEIGKGFKTQIVRRKYVGSLDFKKFDKSAHYHAIIGVDFFKNYIVEINYSNRELA